MCIAAIMVYTGTIAVNFGSSNFSAAVSTATVLLGNNGIVSGNSGCGNGLYAAQHCFVYPAGWSLQEESKASENKREK